MAGLTDTKVDDPATPEFAYWDSYQKFAKRVASERRFATDNISRAFINTVLATVPQRDTHLRKDQILYRAQIGVDFQEDADEETGAVTYYTWGYEADRMKPDPGVAREGRANPFGIAFLYLASEIKTAISEVRPWINSHVSVAQFKILRELRIVDLTKGHGDFAMGLLTFDQLAGIQPVDRETKRRAVWTEIDNAFSRPITRAENNLDYISTQILAESFRDHGYDGIVYRSNFGNPGYNIALFDLNAADVINCAPYQVGSIEVAYSQIGQEWSIPKEKKDEEI